MAITRRKNVPTIRISRPDRDVAKINEAFRRLAQLDTQVSQLAQSIQTSRPSRGTVGTAYKLNLIWSYQMPGAGSQSYSSPIIYTEGGVKYVAFQGWDWYFYSLVAKTGALNWRKAFSAPNYGRPQAADVNGDGHIELFGASHDGQIHSLDHTGANIWQFNNVFDREGTGTATGGGASTLIDATKTWVVNSFESPRIEGAGQGATLNLTGGTGSGQSKEIASVSGTTITVVSPWATPPDATTTYTVTPRYTSDKYFQHAGTLSQESGTWYLYITGFDGQCVKINANTAAIIWKYSAQENNEPYPLIQDVDNDGNLECTFNSVDGKVYCLNASTGALKWSTAISPSANSYQTDAYLVASDINGDGIQEILCGCRDTKVYILKGTDGSVLGQTPGIYGDTYAGVDTRPAILDPVAGKRNFVYGNHEGDVICCDSSGNIVWKVNVGQTVNSSPLYGDLFNDASKVIVVCDMGGGLNVLDYTSGKVLFSTHFTGGIEGVPYLGDVNGDGINELLITTLDGYVKLYKFTR